MDNFSSVALLGFMAFYVLYVAYAVYLLVRVIVRVRKKSVVKSVSSATKELGRIVLSPDRVIIAAVIISTLYLMTKWVVQQSLHGCMTISFWNPVCYDLNQFNRAWFAIFLVIGFNAIILAIVHDTRQQDKKISRSRK